MSWNTMEPWQQFALGALGLWLLKRGVGLRS